MTGTVATHRRRILFVDDEPHLLSGLECTLRRFRSQWDMVFTDSSAVALRFVRERPFDVVVTDLHMRGVDGLGLLAEVKRHCPEATRIILSGTGDQATVLRAVGVAHQFLAKPCGAEELKLAIQRSLLLREQLSSERVARVAGRLRELPSLPSLYLDLQSALQANAGLERIGALVEQDVAMSAKVLQLVNSAFFGLARRFASATEAVKYLGTDTLSALVLSSQAFAQAQGLPPERLELLQAHSLRTGTLARALAHLEGCDRVATETAFAAGMLHDVGLLLLMSELPDELAEAWDYARRLGLPPSEGEHRVIGAAHSILGGYLLGIWGLPDALVQAVAFHHTPAAVAHQGFTPLTAVHVATLIDCGPHGSAFGETERELDLGYLEGLGLGARLPVWRQECARLGERGGR